MAEASSPHPDAASTHIGKLWDRDCFSAGQVQTQLAVGP